MRSPFDSGECVDPDCDCHQTREEIQLELPDEYLPRPKKESPPCESE